MKCAYCNSDIPTGTEVLYDGRCFCNALHLGSWLQQGKIGNTGSAGVPFPTETKRTSGKWWGIILTVLFVAIGSVVGNRIAHGLFSSDSSIDKQLMQAANEFNKNCPVMLDKDTRLDAVIAGPGKTYMYSYTLVNFSSEEVNVPALQEYLRPRMINSMKTDPNMKFFRDNEVTMAYRYLDKAGKFVFEIKVAPGDYK